MISKTFFEYQETTQGGEPIGEKERVWYRDLPAKVSLRCPRMDMKKLAHLIAIAMHGGPVDLSHFERGALIYSARLQLISDRLESPS